MADFFLVQDFVKAEERLVRQDGSHLIFPPDTLLPVLKAQKIKLKKEEDEPGVVREFSFSLDMDALYEAERVLPVSGWPVDIIPGDNGGR